MFEIECKISNVLSLRETGVKFNYCSHIKVKRPEFLNDVVLNVKLVNSCIFYCQFYTHKKNGIFLCFLHNFFCCKPENLIAKKTSFIQSAKFSQEKEFTSEVTVLFQLRTVTYMALWVMWLLVGAQQCMPVLERNPKVTHPWHFWCQSSSNINLHMSCNFQNLKGNCIYVQPFQAIFITFQAPFSLYQTLLDM